MTLASKQAKSPRREVAFGAGSQVLQSTPVNLQSRNAESEAIFRDAGYGVSYGRNFLQRLKEHNRDVRGSSILELGPGTGFGAMAYLAAYGASVSVADRWLAPWQNDYHGAYYAALADLIEQEGAGGDPMPIRRLVEAGTYEGGAIKCLKEPAERLVSCASGSVDVILSNAVLEHIDNPKMVFNELFRVTRPGGIGIHQIDFRDHRDFSRPLEHLLIDPAEFKTMSVAANNEYGSQLRQPDYAAYFETAGFRIRAYASSCNADPAYVEEVMGRLANSPVQFAALRGVLSDLSGMFVVEKP